MEEQIITALIVTPSTPLGEGLDALLRAIPQIDEVEITRSLEKALQQIESRKPRIVLLDFAASRNHAKALLEKIESLSPQTQRVLLVDNVADVKWMPRFAEAILIKGVAPSAVATIVTNLLISKGDTK